MKLYAEYQKYNMFRQPNWRFERVLRLCDRHPTPGRTTKRDDKYIRAARTFVLRWRAREPEDREELFIDNPGLYYAYELFLKSLEEPNVALILEARLLTNTPYKDIADACDTIPDTIEWYEALFFNVRDKLRARDWVTSRVLIPAMMRNFGVLNHDQQPVSAADEDDSDDHAVIPSPWTDQIIARPFLDASLKMFAYFGGPILCEFMIHGFQAGKTVSSVDNLAQFFDEHWALTIRARSAQAARTFSINKFNVMELFATHTRIIELERSEDSLDAKRTTLERHVGALMDEIPWTVGEEVNEQVTKNTKLMTYDAAAAELRDEELMLVSGGKEIKSTDGLELLTMPQPSKKPKAPPADDMLK